MPKTEGGSRFKFVEGEPSVEIELLPAGFDLRGHCHALFRCHKHSFLLGARRQLLVVHDANLEHSKTRKNRHTSAGACRNYLEEWTVLLTGGTATASGRKSDAPAQLFNALSKGGVLLQ
jgi:hypothetical protein